MAPAPEVESDLKTFVITGGANGIGAHIALFFARRGAQVAILDYDKEGLDLLEDRLTRIPPEGHSPLDGRKLAFVHCDVSSEESVKASVQAVIGQFGPGIDGLVNNAGIPYAYGVHNRNKTSFEDWSFEEFMLYHKVHAGGTFLLTREFAPHLEKRAGGVVNMASVRAHLSDPKQEGYASSKGAIRSLTHALAASLGPRGVRVNCISPGFIDVSDATQRSISTFPGPRGKEKDVSRVQMLPKLGRGEDVAKLAWFLANTDESGLITAQDIGIDGGMSKKNVETLKG